MTSRGVVAAGHEKTAEAAALILEAGGNAFDAVLAAACAACIAEPVLASLGGGGFMLAFDGRRPILHDFFVQTPMVRKPTRDIDFYPILADFGNVSQEFHIGMGSSATPGLLRGIFQIHQDHGSLPLKQVFEPAIALARSGVAINELQAYIFHVVSPIYLSTAQSRALFGKSDTPGELLGEGDVLRMPELADTLELIAIEGDRLFYEGEMGSALARDCEHHGGHLTRQDLLAYRSEKRLPLEIEYRNIRLITNPPPSWGGILIAFALKLLEHGGAASAPFGSAQQLSMLARTMEATNKARIDHDLAALESSRDAHSLLDPKLVSLYKDRVHGRFAAQRGTTHISVIDGHGAAASLTLSNGEGNGYMIPGTGIMMNNMLGEEDINPGGFHRWPGNRRIASMMSPSLVLWRDGRMAATGSGGSNRIRTAVLQVILNLVDHSMTLENAVNAPRIHFENGLLNVEKGFTETALQTLASEFREHQFWDEINLFFGGAHCAAWNPQTRALTGAGDPRRGGHWRRV